MEVMSALRIGEVFGLGLFLLSFMLGCVASIPGRGQEYVPDGEETVPGIIVLHDRGGLKQRTANYAHFLSRQGYFAVTANYLTSGGTDNIAAAYRYLATHPKVDANRIGMIGFSKGATQAIHQTAYMHKFTGHRIKAIVSYYIGPRIALGPEIDHPPTLFLHGELDALTPKGLIDYCENLMKRNVRCEAVIYPGVGHGFDITPNEKCSDCDGYDSAVTSDATNRTLRFLDEVLKR